MLEHKRNRQLAVGPNITWSFEDRLTMQYQVQEMLRAERIFEPEGIREELEAYNPLIPDGSNWKATLLMEFPDGEERRAQLAQLTASKIAAGCRCAATTACIAIADEDLRARERREDLRGAFPALRAHRRPWSPL